MSSSLTNQIYSTQNYKHILKLWLIFKTALYLCILIFYILWLYPLVSSRWLAVFLLSCVFLSLSSLWKPTPHLMDRWQCQPAFAPLLSFPCYPPSLSPPCYPPHVIPLMDHCFQTRTIVIKPQVEAPSNYSLFHPPVQKDKTMEVPLSSTYLYENIATSVRNCPDITIWNSVLSFCLFNGVFTSPINTFLRWFQIYIFRWWWAWNIVWNIHIGLKYWFEIFKYLRWFQI